MYIYIMPLTLEIHIIDVIVTVTYVLLTIELHGWWQESIILTKQSGESKTSVVIAKLI